MSILPALKVDYWNKSMVACLMPPNHHKLYFRMTMENPCPETQNIISEKIIERRTKKEQERAKKISCYLIQQLVSYMLQQHYKI